VSTAGLTRCLQVAVAVVLAAGLGLAFALPRGAGSAGRSHDSSPHARDAAGQTALALVSVQPQDVGYSIVFAPARPDLRGQVDPALRRITVFLNPADASHRVAHDIAHELGHAFDSRYLDDTLRHGWLEARGKPDAAWWPGRQMSDYNTGAGDYAEVFALCHAPSPEFRSRLAARPTDACALLAQWAPGTLGKP
jgi:hypothetical protein